jgi:hypothetical protein
VEVNPLSVECSYCREPPNLPCRTSSYMKTRPHKERIVGAQRRERVQQAWDKAKTNLSSKPTSPQQLALDFLQDKVNRGLPASCATKEMDLARKTARGALYKLKVRGETE